MMKLLNNQSGVTAVLVAIMLTMFLGFTALAVDTGHLFVARNELQNAADAGALAGARELYNSDGSAIQTSSNQIAYDTAISNLSEKSPVEVLWEGGNTGDIERGHWSFGRGSSLSRGFYPSESLSPTTLWGVSSGDLDDNANFINAVRATARREARPIASFFATLFGYADFKQAATAVGYIGFAGSFLKYELDQPIAICFDSITTTDDEGNIVFDCSIGRMINSGGNDQTSNTGGWTDFDQSEDCNGVNKPGVTDVITCDSFSGNQDIVESGKLETGGGAIQPALKELIKCWEDKTGKTKPFQMKLPVVTCPGNNVDNCSQLVGGVTVEVIWINGQGTPSYSEAPTKMESTDPNVSDWDWDTVNTDINNDGAIDGKDRWSSFTSHFSLHNVDGSEAPYAQQSVYFKPSCEVAVPSGGTGGANLGVLARIPVLVD